MDASIVVSLRIDSARNFRPSGNREVPRVGHGGRGHSPPGAGRCQWASCGLLVRCLGSAVPSAGFFAGSMSFPQGSLWRERPPPLREGKVARGLATLPPARGAPAPKNWGSLPPPSPPAVRRADAPGEAGTGGGGALRRFTAEDSGNPCQPGPMLISKNSLDHSGEGCAL